MLLAETLAMHVRPATEETFAKVKADMNKGEGK
jgi:hypothetical protein